MEMDLDWNKEVTVQQSSCIT